MSAAKRARPVPKPAKPWPRSRRNIYGWGWQPLQLSGYVEWCGDRIAGIPVPGADGRWRLIVVEGEAS